jgi:hypothetical protein
VTVRKKDTEKYLRELREKKWSRKANNGDEIISVVKETLVHKDRRARFRVSDRKFRSLQIKRLNYRFV